MKKRRGTKLGNGSLPSSFSLETGSRLFNGVVNNFPVHGLTDEYLDSIGITKGTKVSLLGGLRWLGIVDRGDIRLRDRDLGNKLSNPQTRKAFFRDLIEQKYPLLAELDLAKYGYDALRHWFEINNVPSTSSDRVARCFMYFAEEAGIKLAEKLPPIPIKPNLAIRPKALQTTTPVPFASPTSQPKDNTAAKLRLLKIMIEQYENGVVPPDINYMKELMNEVGHLLT